VRESKAKKERDEKRAKRAGERDRKKAGMMGRREAGDKGIWKLDKEQAKCVACIIAYRLPNVYSRSHFRFDLFLPLHRLWLGYMSELLALSTSSSAVSPSSQILPGTAGMHAKLVKADFHGSIMTGALNRLIYHQCNWTFYTKIFSTAKQKPLPCWIIWYRHT